MSADGESNHAKSVADGRLQFVSPSLITKFDSSSKYDCERRGWFVYVLGKKEPTNAKMTRGVYLASMQEEYLKTGKLLLGTEEQTKWFGQLRPHLDDLRDSGRVVGAEMLMPEDFRVAGVRVHPNSKADIVLDGPPEIEDLKTTGNIEKNGKSLTQVKHDTQLHIYRKAFFPDAADVKLTLNYLQVENALVLRPVSVSVSKSVLDTHFETAIVPLVERIKSLVSEKDVKKVPRAHQSKCFRCPHRSYCPPEKENVLMSIFDKFAKKTGTAAPITPADAPKSDPAQAAKPVEGFSPVPAPKAEGEKKRRMLIVDSPATTPVEEGDDEEKAAMAALAAIKAKKAAAVLAAAAAAKAAEEKAAAEAAAAEEVQDDQIVQDDSKEEKKSKGGRPPGAKNKPKMDGEETTEVSYGLTVNMGDFNSVRIDVRRSKRHSAEQADEVYASLLDEVKSSVEAEVQKLSESKSS
jgi:CRISPR/Cas system-associated exonuclease Cas4 (RecB family)